MNPVFNSFTSGTDIFLGNHQSSFPSQPHHASDSSKWGLPLYDAIRKRVVGVFSDPEVLRAEHDKRPSYIRRCIASEIQEIEDEKIRLALDESAEFRKLKQQMKETGMVTPQGARQVLSSFSGS